MFIIKRLLLYLNPLVFIFSLEMIRSQQNIWWVFFAVSVVLLVVTIWDFTKKKLSKNFLFFLLGPLLFLLSMWTFLLFIENVWVFRMVELIGVVFLYLLLEQILNFHYFALKYQPYTLENFSFYTSILSAFFFSASLFSVFIFLRLNIAMVVTVGFILFSLIIFCVFWSNKISWSKSYIFNLIIPFILAELLLALSYLPTNFYVNAFLLTAGFYAVAGLSKSFLTESLNKKVIINYLIVSVTAVIAILLTATWI